jgi:hypothetical protein
MFLTAINSHNPDSGIFERERNGFIFNLAFFRVRWARMQRRISAEQAARQRKASAAREQSPEQASTPGALLEEAVK